MRLRGFFRQQPLRVLCGILGHMDEVTRVLSAIERGQANESDKLLPLVYDELRRLAARKLAHEPPGLTLQPTALVHEVYLRLISGEGVATSWASRGHFFAAAAEAMRRILVDNARRKRSQKHGGQAQRIGVSPDDLADALPDERLMAIDEALGRLEKQFPDKAAVVKLRFFAGLTNADAAQALGISTATAHRYWIFARAWLCNEVADGQED